MSLKQYIQDKITKQQDLKALEQYEKTYTKIAEETKQLESDLFHYIRVKNPKLARWLEQYLCDYKTFAEAVYKDKLIYRATTSKRILNAFDFIDSQLDIINNFNNNKVAEILAPSMYSKAKKDKAESQLKEFLNSKNNKILNEYCENKCTILKLGPTLNMENRPELFEFYHTIQGLNSLLQDKMRKCTLVYNEYLRYYNDYISKHCMQTKKNGNISLKYKHRIVPYNDNWTTSPEQVLLQQIANLDPQTISAEAKDKIEELLSYQTM